MRESSHAALRCYLWLAIVYAHWWCSADEGCHPIKVDGVVLGCSRECTVRDPRFDCNVTVLTEALAAEDAAEARSWFPRWTIGPAAKEFLKLSGRFEMVESLSLVHGVGGHLHELLLAALAFDGLLVYLCVNRHAEMISPR
jgi:hypothetical protein